MHCACHKIILCDFNITQVFTVYIFKATHGCSTNINCMLMTNLGVTFINIKIRFNNIIIMICILQLIVGILYLRQMLLDFNIDGSKPNIIKDN